jgi:uncharacterized protein (DUF2237 family)
MTESFLEFSASRGNDLMMPMPDYKFPGLRAGDFWCVCLSRWIEAYEAGVAPKIKLEATHASVSEFVDMETLKDSIATSRTEASLLWRQSHWL